jgi:4-hydroxyproline epimerase
MSRFPESIEVIDSHTEGEPTRVVVDGWPEPRGASMAERRAALRRDADHLRRAVVCEPRGHEAVVGALLTSPVSAEAVAGVVFFNNVGYLGMCGHGLIGVVKTLAALGRTQTGDVQLDTPVGPVGARLEDDGSVTLRNVPSFCRQLDVRIEVPGLGPVTGDVGWGGNWFFLTQLPEPPLELARLGDLLAVCRQIRTALDEADLLGGEGVIDHVELFGPSPDPSVDSRNFVLCPGGEYDRSPCGTGTSAKLAVLHARGQLRVDEEWCQESVTGGRFLARLTEEGGDLVPLIRGRAWIVATSTLRFEADDPFRGGFSPTS